MMLKKDLIKKTRIYTRALIDQIRNWKEILFIGTNSSFKMEEEDLKRVYYRAFNYIQRIISNKDEYLLTDDLLFFIVYKSIHHVNYADKIIEILRKISERRDTDKIYFYKEFLNELVIKTNTSLDLSVSKSDKPLMTKEQEEAFKVYQENYKKLLDKNPLVYEFEILDTIAAVIYVRCSKEGKLSLYREICKKYFDDINKTIDFFKMNGFIDEDLGLIDEFIKYVDEDMKKEGSCLPIK